MERLQQLLLAHHSLLKKLRDHVSCGRLRDGLVLIDSELATLECEIERAQLSGGFDQ